MANISDVIEQFLIQLLQDGNIVSISRNELANYFSCAPSQINYVLTTRFTPARGYAIESAPGRRRLYKSRPAGRGIKTDS